MKMILLEMIGITGAASLIGYMYIKKHPEKLQQMKENLKEMSCILYNKLDSED